MKEALYKITMVERGQTLGGGFDVAEGAAASAEAASGVLPVGVRALVFDFFFKGEADEDFGVVALKRGLRIMLGGGVGFLSDVGVADSRVGVETVGRFRACWSSLE